MAYFLLSRLLGTYRLCCRDMFLTFLLTIGLKGEMGVMGTPGQPGSPGPAGTPGLPGEKGRRADSLLANHVSYCYCLLSLLCSENPGKFLCYHRSHLVLRSR